MMKREMKRGGERTKSNDNIVVIVKIRLEEYKLDLNDRQIIKVVQMPCLLVPD